jgi:hypothetical protein
MNLKSNLPTDPREYVVVSTVFQPFIADNPRQSDVPCQPASISSGTAAAQSP